MCVPSDAVTLRRIGDGIVRATLACPNEDITWPCSGTVDPWALLAAVEVAARELVMPNVKVEVL